MKFCRIYATLPQTYVLGPYLRFALWVQGCKRNCDGCMSPDSIPLNGGNLLIIKDLADEIIKDTQTEGITISGGEPFLQAEAMVNLIKTIRKNRDFGVIVYTGYKLDELTNDSSANQNQDNKEFLKHIDLLIDGPYIKSLNDGINMRGSSNQEIHLLTKRYESIFWEYYMKNQRSVEVHMLKKEVFLAGIPGACMLSKWKDKFR